MGKSEGVQALDAGCSTLDWQSRRRDRRFHRQLNPPARHMAHLQWHKDQLVPPPTPPSPSAAAAAVVASPRATPLADIPPGHSDVAFAGCYLALRVRSVSGLKTAVASLTTSPLQRSVTRAPRDSHIIYSGAAPSSDASNARTRASTSRASARASIASSSSGCAASTTAPTRAPAPEPVPLPLWMCVS